MNVKEKVKLELKNYSDYYNDILIQMLKKWWFNLGGDKMFQVWFKNQFQDWDWISDYLETEEEAKKYIKFAKKSLSSRFKGKFKITKV